MAAIAGWIGVPSFAYLVVPEDLENPAYLISNYPDHWTKPYIEGHLERFDPVIGRACEDEAPFAWDGNLGSKEHQRFFLDASANGIRYGFTLPIHDTHGGRAALTLATDQGKDALVRVATRNLVALEAAASTLHALVRSRFLSGLPLNGAGFTRNECECIEWAIAGKTAWEIGEIIGRSERTVRERMERAKARAGVRTKAELIAAYVKFRQK